MNTLPDHITQYCSKRAYQSATKYKRNLQAFKTLRAKDNMVFYTICEHEWKIVYDDGTNLYGCKICGFQVLYKQ